MNVWKFAIPLLLSVIPFAAAQEARVPLFVIEHSASTNVVQYEAKLRGGKIDPQQPVIAFWVMNAENGRHQELNVLERVKAYGFSVRPDQKPDSYLLTIVSDKKREIHIFRDGDAIRAEARIGSCDAYLQKIFIAQKKSFLLNLPDYAEMIGKDISTGAECHEKVLPADR
jgi:hypothetical protein